jgi:hypothetical protein
MFPCTKPVGGNRPNGKTPGLEVEARPLKEPLKGIRIKPSDTRYSVRTAKSERAGDGHLEVLADHSTEGQCPMSGR